MGKTYAHMHINIYFSVGLRTEELYPNTFWKISQICKVPGLNLFFKFAYVRLIFW